MKTILLMLLLQSGQLTPTIVLQKCEELGIKYPKIVVAQSIEETRWYQSYNCCKRNNLFGMKGGKKTESNTKGFKIFDSWVESVQDYKKWQDRNYSGGDYFAFLDRIGYASNPKYEPNVRSIIKKLWPD